MATTTNTKILLYGAPIGWMYNVTIGSGSGDDTLAAYAYMDNLAESTVRLLEGPASSSGENIDINRGDGAIWRFKKDSLILDGTDETDITPVGSSAEATNWGEMMMTLNEAPTQFTSMTSFIASVNAHKVAGTKFLVIQPFAYSYNRLGTGVTRKPDGYAYMIGKITSAIEVKSGNSPTQIAITFGSFSLAPDAGFPTTKTFTSGSDGILVKRGGTGKDIEATYNVPKDLDASAILLLEEGKVVIIENS